MKWWHADIIKLQIVAACVALFFIICGIAHGDEGPKVHAEVKNAWDNTHVWLRVAGVTQPFTCIVESRDTSGRLMESQTGITVQMTLDDDWRTINVIAVYSDKQFIVVSIRARFQGHTPIYETIKGEEEKKK